MRSIPDLGPKIPYAIWHDQEIENIFNSKKKNPSSLSQSTRLTEHTHIKNTNRDVQWYQSVLNVARLDISRSRENESTLK